MTNLAVTIITKNEQENISDCIDSVKNLSDEIVVLDCGSTDKTVQIAKKKGAKVFHRDFDNFANQKNEAAKLTKKEWIFSLDADERATPQLVEEIKQTIETSEFDGYLIPRRNFILGGEIKYSRWSPDKHIWLWKANRGNWQGEVHEEVVVEGRVGELQSAKLHYQDKSLSDFFLGNNYYSTLLAKKMYQEGARFSWFRFFWDPFFEFCLRFLYKRGFLDGWRGLSLIYILAVYKIMIWIKIWEIQKTQK